MNESMFLEKLAEVSKLPVDAPDDTAIQPEEWDSIELLDLIAAMDESYGVSLSAETITSCKTLGALKSAVAAARG